MPEFTHEDIIQRTGLVLDPPFLGRSLIGLSANPPPQIVGLVVVVNDGDTLTILTVKRQQYRIRLQGIDAPEKGQAFGDRAKQNLSALVFGKEVLVLKRDVDRYKRIVGRVRLGSADVNIAVVSSGHAWWYREYAPNDMDLLNAEKAARDSKRGLWSDPLAMPPWDWRDKDGNSMIAEEVAQCCK